MEDGAISAKLTKRSKLGSMAGLPFCLLSCRRGDDTAGVGAGPSVSIRFTDGCRIGALLGESDFDEISAESLEDGRLPAAAQQVGC